MDGPFDLISEFLQWHQKRGRRRLLPSAVPVPKRLLQSAAQRLPRRLPLSAEGRPRRLPLSAESLPRRLPRLLNRSLVVVPSSYSWSSFSVEILCWSESSWTSVWDLESFSVLSIDYCVLGLHNWICVCTILISFVHRVMRFFASFYCCILNLSMVGSSGILRGRCLISITLKHCIY